jgi:hypothetical protein
MSDVPSNGYHLHAPTIAAVASVVGIVIYVAGFASGYIMMRQNLNDLQSKLIEMQAEMSSMSTRLIKLEDKVDYTAQGIADLKALTAGTKR